MKDPKNLEFPAHRLADRVDDGRPFRLGIVIPLKGRLTARRWDIVEDRLRATVASLAQQTSSAWEAVIVCQDRPDLDHWHLPNLSFVPFEPATAGGPRAQPDFRSKIAHGFRLLGGRGSITHWFRLDADDLLHDAFVEIVSQMPAFDLAVVRRGFLYYPDCHRYQRCDHLDRICGSTVLVADRWWDDPTAPDGRRYGFIGHLRAEGYGALRGVPIHEVPGRGVAYVLGHGENDYDRLLRRIRNWLSSRFLARPCDAAFERSFAAYRFLR